MLGNPVRRKLEHAYQEVEEVKADRDVAESHAVDGLTHHLSGEVGQAEDEVRLGHAHRGHHLKAVEMGWIGALEGRKEGRKDGWMDGWMDGWLHGWMDGRTDGWMDG